MPAEDEEYSAQKVIYSNSLCDDKESNIPHEHWEEQLENLLWAHRPEKATQVGRPKTSALNETDTPNIPPLHDCC